MEFKAPLEMHLHAFLGARFPFWEMEMHSRILHGLLFSREMPRSTLVWRSNIHRMFFPDARALQKLCNGKLMGRRRASTDAQALPSALPHDRRMKSVTKRPVHCRR
jgi:hypothetical protein